MKYQKKINLERGVIDREIFTAQQVFDDEMERVFTRSWLFVGHESLIPNPGDYFTSRMGVEPVILTVTKRTRFMCFTIHADIVA